MILDELFEASVAEIRKEYERRGGRGGWRFLSTPRSTFSHDVTAALLSFHPGGAADDFRTKEASFEQGSAYVHESWMGKPPGTHHLQQQVRAMFAWLGLDPDATLTGYFIPFREPDKDLLDFGVRLWKPILRESHPRLVVCLGNDTEQGLYRVWGPPRTPPALHELGWGAYTAALSRYDDHVLLRLPHLSIFRIFERAKSAGYLRDLRNRLDEQLATVP